MFYSSLDPRVYEKEIDPVQYSLYIEIAQFIGARKIEYNNGTIYLEFESHSDLEDFTTALQSYKLQV